MRHLPLRCVLSLAALILLLPFGLACRQADAPSTDGSDAAEAGPEVTVADQLAPELGSMVEVYRKIIVLTTDEVTLPAADQPLSFVVGKLLFDRNAARLELLRERLVHDLDTAASVGFRPAPALIEAFLDQLESTAEWRDADKLVFRDLVHELEIHLETLAPRSPVGKSLGTRLEEDRKALDEIQALYDDELDEVFSRFRTRGMTITREAWEDYVTFLRSLHTALDVVDELRAEVATAEVTSVEVAPAEASASDAPSDPPKASTSEEAKTVKTDQAVKMARTVNGRGLPPKTVVLTFDDGPHPRHTEAVLEILDRFQVKSIFFKVGQNVGRVDAEGHVKTTRSAAGSRKVSEAGHLVAHHSFTHAFLPKLSAEAVGEELDLTSRVLEEVVNLRPAIFRPPYGALNDEVRAVVAQRDMLIMLWNVDSRDWADPVPRSIANRVIAEVRELDRGVVLFHDIHKRTVEALPLVLETLQAEGFRFVLWDGEKVLADEASKPAVADLPPLRFYRESFAVIIGINDYEKWPKLSHAVADAQGMRDLLVSRFDFKLDNVHLLLDRDATRERVLEVLGDVMGDPSYVDGEDRVLVFFAGHGTTRQLSSGRSLGYIVPVEADTKNFHSQAISMTTFQDVNEAIPAKHVLYLMDACYGGLALTRAGSQGFDPRKYLREVTSRSVRQILTAGGADEEVADGGPGGHSIFTWTLLQGLEGLADLNGDRHVTASELFTYVGPVVASQSQQTPTFGNLAGSQGGEFVFALAREDHFLSRLSEQLDDEAIRLNAELESYRAQIARKRERNRQLASELEVARAETAQAGGERGLTPAERARDLLNEGLVLYREKKLDEALEIFLEAFELQPSSALAANNVGFAYYKMERYEDALEWYGKTLALDPQRAVAHLNLGEAYEQLGRLQDAEEAYRRFLELAPGHPGAAGVRDRRERLATS